MRSKNEKGNVRNRTERELNPTSTPESSGAGSSAEPSRTDAKVSEFRRRFLPYPPSRTRHFSRRAARTALFPQVRAALLSFDRPIRVVPEEEGASVARQMHPVRKYWSEMVSRRFRLQSKLCTFVELFGKGRDDERVAGTSSSENWTR
jgi:hypothetical protein